MSNVLLPILPGTLPANYCFTSWQKTLNDFSDAQKAVLSGQSFYNFGDTRPAPEFEAYPWLNTNDGRWYIFNGDWLAPNNYSQFDRRWFAGTLTDLVTYDGGDSGTPGPSSGPMWVEDDLMRARFPVGQGTFPSTLAVSVGDTGGNEQHTLTDAEGATGVHTHAFGLSNPGNDDAYFSHLGAPNTVSGYQGYYITGSNGNILANLTTADLQTLPAGTAGTGVTPTAFSLLPPYLCQLYIKPSGRLYYKA